MRLYASKVSPISDEILHALVSGEHIEVESNAEAKLDIESVLKEFLRMDREITEEAKSRMESRGMEYGTLPKIKSQLSKERGAPPPDEILPYLLEQILNILFHSPNFAEVFSEDVALRTVITPILRKNLEAETDLDAEVRGRIKNLQEGTATFDIEYAKVMDQIKRKHGLS